MFVEVVFGFTGHFIRFWGGEFSDYSRRVKQRLRGEQEIPAMKWWSLTVTFI